MDTGAYKPRRTKILATLGPATDDPKVLDQLIESGVDVVRLNFSHGSIEDHRIRAEAVRKAAKAHGRYVGVMADLQGPKIRIGQFEAGKIQLQPGDAFIIDVNHPIEQGQQQIVGCTYQTLIADVTTGDRLLLDDGRLVFEVVDIKGSQIHCTVVIGGELSNSKGINLQGGGLSADALTEKDKSDITVAAELGVDFVAVSFPKSASDIQQARQLVQQAGSQAHIVAKIERAEALDVLEEIVDASDVVMVARGDLGVEIGDASLPPVQKALIKMARRRNTAVITATQMMESMIENAIPTRAEVFDVANATADGTDAVMLSGETSVGKHPVQTVEAMSRICKETERQPRFERSKNRMEESFDRVDEAIANASMFIANRTDIKAIATFSETGTTPMRMSRIRSGIPIFAMVPNETICRRVTMYRGVIPVLVDMSKECKETLNQTALNVLEQMQVVKKGDLVLITSGELTGYHGGTNSLKIMQIE